MTETIGDREEPRNDYPYLIVRHAPAVYGRMRVRFVESTEEPPARHALTLVWPGAHRHTDGNVLPECRRALVEAVRETVRRSGLRICLVFGPQDCEYVELDGSVNRRADPPSMRIRLPSGDVELDMEISGGRILDAHTRLLPKNE